MWTKIISLEYYSEKLHGVRSVIHFRDWNFWSEEKFRTWNREIFEIENILIRNRQVKFSATLFRFAQKTFLNVSMYIHVSIIYLIEYSQK